MNLKTIVTNLHATRDKALELIGKTMNLAGEAGQCVASARKAGQDVSKLCISAGITEEEGRRLERCASRVLQVEAGQTNALRQTYLLAGLLPDPIVESSPSEPKSPMFPVIKFSQWFDNRAKAEAWSDEQNQLFVRELERPVRRYLELTKGS